MNVSEYIIQSLANQGVSDIFILPGGGCMYLVDALAKGDQINPVPLLHEQSVGIAAEAFAQFKNSLGVALVTTGPGATNAITPCAAAWTDSTPMLFISGQVKTEDSREKFGVRQFGFQEIPIVEMVSRITKKAITVSEASQIPTVLRDLIELAISGRPGPVWLDVPLDVQSQVISETPIQCIKPLVDPNDVDRAVVQRILDDWNKSKRPIIFLGNGVRLAGAAESANKLIAESNTPALLTWKALDLLDSQNPLNAGRPGAIAQRWSNFAQQTADFMLVIGARLDLGQTAYRPANFAPNAVKYVVDIDPCELKKLDGLGFNLVNADSKTIIEELLNMVGQGCLDSNFSPWVSKIAEWKSTFPLIQEKHLTPSSGVNLYPFIEHLSECMLSTDLLVPGSSGACSEISMQAFMNKSGQRVLNSEGLGPMGFGIAAPIGACIASGGQRTISIDGDGGFLMNVQELASLEFLNLPIKIFVLNNNGYGSIKTSQDRYFDGRRLGTDRSSLLGLPDIENVVRGFNLTFHRLVNFSQVLLTLETILAEPGPAIIELIVDPDQITEPRVFTEINEAGGFSTSSMENLVPKLSDADLKKALIWY